MLAAAERWGGGEDERPFLPRAFSVARAPRDGTLDFVLEDVGPGTRRLAELRRRRRALAARPARPRLRAAARRRAARCSSAAASGSRRWRSGRTRSAPRRPRCSASATPPHAEGAALIPGARVATDDGSRRPPRPGDRAAARPSSARPARRGLRLRPAADARGGAGAVRRARRAGAARPGVRHGLRLRRLLRLRRADAATATCGCASTAPCSTRTWSAREVALAARKLGPRSSVLRHPAGAPDHQRLGHVRRDRRPARVRRRAARALPVRRLRLQDRHARAAPGQPAAAAVGARRRDDQLDRAAQQGARGLPGRGPAASSPSCRCR